jgi:hypothetical protein
MIFPDLLQECAFRSNTELDDSCSSRLRKAYVVAGSPAFLNHCHGAPKRSGGGLVIVLVLNLLDFCVEERPDGSAIILFCHCDAKTSIASEASFANAAARPILLATQKPLSGRCLQPRRRTSANSVESLGGVGTTTSTGTISQLRYLGLAPRGLRAPAAFFLLPSSFCLPHAQAKIVLAEPDSIRLVLA